MNLPVDDGETITLLPPADPAPDLLPADEPAEPASDSGSSSAASSSSSTPALPFLAGTPADGAVYMLVGGAYAWIPDADTFNALGLDWSAITWADALPAGVGDPLVSLRSVSAPAGGGGGPAPVSPAGGGTGSSSASGSGGLTPLPDPATWAGSLITPFEVTTYVELGYPAADVLEWQRLVNESLAARGIASPTASGADGGGSTAPAGGGESGERELLYAVPAGFFGPTHPAGVAASWRQLVDVFRYSVPAQHAQVKSLATALTEVFK